MAHAPGPPESMGDPGAGGDRSRPVLVLTAGMGEGHNGVARELARRLEAAGRPVHLVDVLEVLPFGFGGVMRAFYSLMVRHVPWLYDVIYALWFRPEGGHRGGPVSPVTLPIERHVARWIEANDPVAAVSTFHLCSQVLGHLRQRGVLRAPAVSVVVDMAVHRLWVHPDVDLHLCYHPAAAATAARRGAPRVEAPGPVVRPAFSAPTWDRRAARRALGFLPEDRVVLVAGGSWGVGEMEATVKCISRSGRYQTLVVCGHNADLRRRLSTVERVVAMGWVDDMARLVVAADVFVDNAGGLTCMESLAAGTPVVCAQPLPGHGRANISSMVASNVVSDATTDIVGTLDAIARPGAARDAVLEAAREMFAGDVARDVLAIAAESSQARRSAPTAPVS